MALSIDESSSAIVAVGICKVANLDISISKGSDQLVGIRSRVLQAWNL